MSDPINRSYIDFDHDEFARSRPRDDFFGQIRRTVNGKPVSEDQMELIEKTIATNLSLRPRDRVLDLACGNGALSCRLFGLCEELHGVDLSEFLISVAQEFFETGPKYTFSQHDMVDFLLNTQTPTRYNKALCYGSFSYLSESAAKQALSLLYSRFTNIERVYVGNLPDYDRRHMFFTQNMPSEVDLRSHTTAIGIWRSEPDFRALAIDCGWTPTIYRMEHEFYASQYRYDALLERHN